MITLRRSTILADVAAVRRSFSAGDGGGLPPARVRVGKTTASDVAEALTDAKTRADFDDVFRDYLRDGDVPRYVAKDDWVSLHLAGGGHTLELLVMPDYGAVGASDSPFRIGNESQDFAQEYADAFDAVLPSQKLLRAIEAAASPKIAYIPVQKGGGEDASIAGLIRANDLAEQAMEAAGASPADGDILIQYRKAYVVRPGLDGRYIAIYGGRYPGGGLVQPTSGKAHGAYYSGPSHGIVLVSRKTRLDGEWVDLRDDVFGSDDPSVVALVSDEGRFDPVFPNAGAGSLAKFSVPGGASTVAPGGPPPKKPVVGGPGAGMTAGRKVAWAALAAGVGYAVWKAAA
jgi:hypothetical protein